MEEKRKRPLDGGTLTEAGVLGENLCELVTLVLVVATVVAVAVGRHADFGRAQVVGSHYCTCGGRDRGREGSVHLHTPGSSSHPGKRC